MGSDEVCEKLSCGVVKALSCGVVKVFRGDNAE